MTSIQERENTELVPVVDTELAEPVVTISRRLWAATALLAVVLVVAGAWGWFGRWSQHLDATAIVVHGTAPVVVVASSPGTVTAVAVDVGDTVRPGARIATIVSHGAAHPVTATTTGTVLSVVSPGTQVTASTALAQLDPVTQQAHAYLLVSDTDALTRLAVGQRVTIGSPVGSLAGRISGVRSTATTSADLSHRFLLPIAHPSDTPVWLVDVTLDPGTPVVAQTVADARVQLPSIRVYRVLLGGGA